MICPEPENFHWALIDVFVDFDPSRKAVNIVVCQSLFDAAAILVTFDIVCRYDGLPQV